MSTTETPPRLLTLAEAARRLSVSRATAYRMVHDGRLPTVRLGSRSGQPLRVPEHELERWLYSTASVSPLDAREVPAERGVPASGQSTSPQPAGIEERRG